MAGVRASGPKRAQANTLQQRRAQRFPRTGGVPYAETKIRTGRRSRKLGAPIKVPKKLLAALTNTLLNYLESGAEEAEVKKTSLGNRVRFRVLNDNSNWNAKPHDCRKILNARKQLGLSREEFAHRGGVSTRLVAELERGQRPNVSLESALKLLNAAGVSVVAKAPSGVTAEIRNASVTALERAARAARRRQTWTGRKIHLHDDGDDPRPGTSKARRVASVAQVSTQAFLLRGSWQTGAQSRDRSSGSGYLEPREHSGPKRCIAAARFKALVELMSKRAIGEANDALSPDFLDFIVCLNKRRVKVALVGGYALGVHGVIRATGDIDFLYRRTKANVLRLCSAMEDFGVR